MPQFSFTLNGQQVTVDSPGDLSVLWVLRDKLGVTGPKYGCGINVCKACTSHLDGEAFNPCVTNVRDVEGREVTTIEGLAASFDPAGDQLHPVQEAWLEQDVAQCGFCQPGQIMAAVALLRRTLEPTEADLAEIDNVCRCGTYFRIREAIESAAATLRARRRPGSGRPPADVPPVVPAGGVGPASTGAPTVAAAALPATGLGGAATAGAAAVAAGAVAARVLRADDATS